MTKIKDLEKLKHPNSRKTKSLVKNIRKSEKKNNNKLGTHIRDNLIGEKLLWFKERLPEGSVVLDKEQTLQLIESYLKRFDDELEQIVLKNSIGKRKNRQHASREDVINITKKREVEEFESCGLEMANLMDPQQMEVLMNWNGELRFLQNFKLKRIARKHLT